jgi:hypothetical protein
MTLDASEFIRRFLLHVLPDSFMRSRHYDLLGNRHRRVKITQCRELLLRLSSQPIQSRTRIIATSKPL